MIPSFVLSLREGLEASLIIGIVLGALHRSGRSDLNRSLWIGVISAGILSVLTALLLRGIGKELEGRSEQIFEGLTLLLAAGVLTWMIFWMSNQSRSMKAKLESNVDRAANLKGQGAIFFLALIAVLREGIELALYLTAVSLTSNGIQILLGTMIGLLFASLLGYLIFTATLRLNLQRFFQVTAFILILFAGGLITHSVAEFNEAGIIPTLIHPIWNLNPYLNDQSIVGMIFRTLFGYYGSPSLTQVLGYSLYISIIVLVLFKTRNLQLN
jgi:high-affinity iron transporter